MMGLPQYDKSLDDVSGVTTDGGQVVMDAISDDQLDEFRRYCFESERGVFTAACGGKPAMADFRPARDWDEGDGSEADIFFDALK
jgi:hypothetical protein